MINFAALYPKLSRLWGYLLRKAPAAGETGVRSAVRDAFVWNTLNLLSSQGVSLAVFLWLSHALEPAVFGVFALAVLAVDIFTVQLKSAAGDAIVQQADYSPRSLSTAFFCLLPLCAAAPLAAWFSAGWLARLFEAPALAAAAPALALSVLFTPVLAVCEGVALGRFGYRLLALRNVGSVLASALVAVAVGLSPAREWTLVAQRLTQSVFATGFLMLQTGWRPQALFDPAFAMRYSLAALQMWLAQFLAVASGWLGLALMGYRLGPATLGVARVIGRFPETLHGPLTHPVSTLLIPALARLREDPQQTRRLVLELVGLSALLSVPAFAGLAAVAPDLAKALLGPDYADAGAPLAVMALAQVLTPLGYFVDGVLSGLRRNGLRLLLSVFDMLLIGATIWWFAAYGLLAALWGAFGAALITTVLAIGLQRAALKVPAARYLSAAAPAYLAAAVMCLAVTLFRVAAADWPALARLLAACGLGTMVYAAFLWVFFRGWTMRGFDMLRGRGRFALEH